MLKLSQVKQLLKEYLHIRTLGGREVTDEPCTLITVNTHYGGHVHVIRCNETQVCTKVVKFDNPLPNHTLPHYVVIHSLEEMTDEDACEMAIDEVLKFKGFDEFNAQPQLVI